jgi:hypothetical protein
MDLSSILFTAIPPTITALVGIVISLLNRKGIQNVRLELNGRLTELLLKTGSSEFHRGQSEARAGQP